MSQRLINRIVIHCSATKNGDDLFRHIRGQSGVITPAQTIDSWHKARKFNRSAAFRKLQNPHLGHIGYHFLIYRNGTVETGRHLNEIGAHAFGFNQASIGICLIGIDQYTLKQWDSLAQLVSGIEAKYSIKHITGHRDLSPDKNGNGVIEPFEWLKTCPGFSVYDWIAGGKTAVESSVYGESGHE